MDSKQKFVKNRYWKKKYQPRNASNVGSKHVSDKSSNPVAGEIKNGLILAQPIPKEGWFPETDSSETSDSEDFENILGFNSLQKKEFDKNWFDRELDNVQINPEFVCSQENIKGTNDIIVEYKSQASILKVEKQVTKSFTNNNVFNYPCDDEEELDFLLSLKEPVYASSGSMKRDNECDKKLLQSVSCIEEKPVKTIDLEKWLDTVIND